ncbi:MAG: 3-hydroxyacyl-CoA dehydrogenase NAD-binding domain-containing protein [Sphingomonadales bacterium]|jgi:3-hydroxyacyl-CoA dehydrogenase/enoyl-CoA hydratase/3-hydroxybutyryl-CoA epimerase
MTETIKYEVDGDGIALLTIDVPGQTMNVITPEFQRDLEELIDRIVADDAVKGAVITSGKTTSFMAGADLKGMSGILKSESAKADKGAIFDKVFNLNRLFRKMETCGKPFAAAINGLALGGGLEICLACHYRVVGDSPKIQLGLPEVMVGLLPGAGGTQRLPRIIGAQPALMYLAQGKNMKPQEAVGLGVAQAIAPVDEVVAKAKEWIKTGPSAVQPWDEKKFKFPGGAGWANRNFVTTFMGGIAMVNAETNGNYEAPKAIMSCVYEGAQLPFDTAIRLESKYFLKLLTGTQAPNMIRTLFVNKQAAERGARRPQGIEKMPTKKLGMLGAGLMGAGIAFVSAKVGIEVVLLDRNMDAANKGKDYSVKLVEKATKRGKMTKEKGEELLGRIHTTDNYDDLKGCDLIIEAVFEARDIKADVTKKTEAVVGSETIFGSNTSTLPISSLAEAWSEQENFIGIHFFSPVEKMPLVEIITGKNTGDKAIAKALDYVAQIKKTPIVVNDSRGFYTSRCFGTYVMEGYSMIGEGVTPALVDNCGRQAGMPVGPMAVGDEVAIDLSWKVMQATKKDLGDAYKPGPADEVVEKMYELGRYGRKTAKGFYVYPEDGSKKYIWPGLDDLFPQKPESEQPDAAEVKTRLIYRQLVECARCFEEGVLETPEDGDLGAIFGWGFAPFTGGPFSHMDTVGIDNVVKELDRLAQAYGERFAPPQLLRDMAAKGETFYGKATAKKAA